MFEKSQILRATPHQHINLKQSLKNRNPQILDVEYAQNLWIPKLHRNCNK